MTDLISREAAVKIFEDRAAKHATEATWIGPNREYAKGPIPDATYRPMNGPAVAYLGELDHIAAIRSLPAAPGVVVPSETEIEAVTKAILFEDCGNTSDWEDNAHIGRAAIKAMRNTSTQWRNDAINACINICCRYGVDEQAITDMQALLAAEVPK